MDKETIEAKVKRLICALSPRHARRPEAIGNAVYDFDEVRCIVELAIAEEREACAVVAEGEGHYMCEDAQDTAKGIADLIRSRSEA